MKVNLENVMLIIACLFIIYGLYQAYVFYHMYVGFKLLGKKRGVKNVSEKHTHKDDKKDDMRKICLDSNREDIDNCDHISFENCIKCSIHNDGHLVSHHCSESPNATKEQCLDNDSTKAFPLVDTNRAFCSSNQNATFDDCQKYLDYGDVYCHNNPKVTIGTTEYEKCKDHYSKSPGQCASNDILRYEDCEKYDHQLDYCARNPNVIRNSDGMEKCCLSGDVDKTDYLQKYIDNYIPIPFTKPKIEELSLKNPDDINTYACTLRENCKNIEVTPDNVYLARPLCSNIILNQIGHNENVIFDFSDTICSNITKQVEDTFYNVNIKDIKDGYENLIQEYCHCLNHKPDICELFDVKPKETN